MLKRILLLVCLVMTICSSAFAASDQEYVDSFVAKVKEVMNPIESSFAGEHYRILGDAKSGYFKAKEINFSYNYDLKKTDSLINPYIGIINMTKDVAFYARSKDYQTAEYTTVQNHVMPGEDQQLIYHYQNGQWVLSKVMWRLKSSGGPLKDVGLEDPSKFACHDNIRK